MNTNYNSHKISMSSKLTTQKEGKDSITQTPSTHKSSLRNSKEGSHGSSPCQLQQSKRSERISDLMAAMYPGIHFGHKHCVPQITMVPKTMGWLWNSEDKITGPFPRGYQPGAIALGVKENLFQTRSVSEPMATPIGSKGKKTRGKRVKQGSETLVKSRSESLTPLPETKLPPTLLIRKEKGVYRVTMQPIHPNATENEEPVQFKIKEDSENSYSGTSTSSSTIKIEYLCTGARRKPIIKPELAEISTQWDVSDLPIVEAEKKKKETSKTEEEMPKDLKKKGKMQAEKSPSKDITEGIKKKQENTEGDQIADKKKNKEKAAT